MATSAKPIKSIFLGWCYCKDIWMEQQCIMMSSTFPAFFPLALLLLS